MEARKAGSVSWVVGMGVGMGEGVVSNLALHTPVPAFHGERASLVLTHQITREFTNTRALEEHLRSRRDS